MRLPAGRQRMGGPGGLSAPRRGRGGGALALFLFFSFSPAFPQSASRPGLGLFEARRPVAVSDAPWSSLVRVHTDSGALCSGVLIAPDRVLTAAHCLLSPTTGRIVPAAQVHAAVAGPGGDAEVVGLMLGPGVGAMKQVPVGDDLAVLRLASPLPGPVLPLAPTPQPGAPAMLGGWQQDRAQALLADTACTVTGQFLDERGRLLLQHGCAATRGSSGAPLLVRAPAGTGWAVAGIASGALPAARGGLAVSIAGLKALR